MIVLDEHLEGLGLEGAIKRWYRGQVTTISNLRPGSIVKDDGIPMLLGTVPSPTFVTLNWRHFWLRTEARESYCVVCIAVQSEQARAMPEHLRRLFRLDHFKTKAARMGKVARVSGNRVAFYRAHDPREYSLPLP